MTAITEPRINRREGALNDLAAPSVRVGLDKIDERPSCVYRVFFLACFHEGEATGGKGGGVVKAV